MAICFHLFVIGYAEPTLHRKFGEDYDEYRQSVFRWIHGGHGCEYPEQQIPGGSHKPTSSDSFLLVFATLLMIMQALNSLHVEV